MSGERIPRGSREYDDEIVEMYEAGYPMKSIGDSIGVSLEFISRRLKWQGVRIRARGERPRGRNIPLRQKIVELYNEGLIVREVAEKVNLHPTTVSYHLHKSGIDNLRQKRKCKNGHDLTKPGSVYLTKKGKYITKVCRKCKKKWNATEQARVRALKEASLELEQQEKKNDD